MRIILNSWGTSDFRRLFRGHLREYGQSVLPLQQGLQHSSVALDDDVDVMILSENETSQYYLVKVGVFYQGVIAGCSCADDPTPVVKQTEYCEVLCEIDKHSYEMAVHLLT